jgi:hypothetical protein
MDVSVLGCLPFLGPEKDFVLFLPEKKLGFHTTPTMHICLSHCILFTGCMILNLFGAQNNFFSNSALHIKCFSMGKNIVKIRTR